MSIKTDTVSYVQVIIVFVMSYVMGRQSVVFSRIWVPTGTVPYCTCVLVYVENKLQQCCICAESKVPPQ